MFEWLDVRSLLFACAATLTLVSFGKQPTSATVGGSAIEADPPEGAAGEMRAGKSGDVAYRAIAAAVADPARLTATANGTKAVSPKRCVC